METWAATVIILRELFISAFRFYFLISNASFSASMLAKLKTGFQLVSVGVLIIYPKLPFSELLRIVGTVGIYLAVILTVYSGVDYIIKYGKVIRT